jgi:FkbM family methyltransferase
LSESVEIERFFEVLPTLTDRHAPSDPLHQLLKQAAHQAFAARFGSEDEKPVPLGPFGDLVFPYFRMGAVDSVNLFDLDELILFSYYWTNRARYQRAVDIGGNLGLHSILMSRCGFEVRTFEPDPVHADELERRLALNGVDRVSLTRAAVSSEDGELEFVRVKGNTTGSHLSGAKPNPYGELERFPVPVKAVGPLVDWADLIKLDAEGHEAEILCATAPDQWKTTDAVVEVGSADNADCVFEHFKGTGIRLFAQRQNWRQVTTRAEMPESYKHGSLFISARSEMTWTPG